MVLPGLVRGREAEVELFTRGQYATATERRLSRPRSGCRAPQLGVVDVMALAEAREALLELPTEQAEGSG